MLPDPKEALAWVIVPPVAAQARFQGLEGFFRRLPAFLTSGPAFNALLLKLLKVAL
jgi:hypothetical protein